MALAFLASVGLFLLTAVLPIRGEVVLIVLVGIAYVYLVLYSAQRHGPLYAVPLAIAGGLAFDSFYIPPTRDFGAYDWQNWLVVLIYISMGVLIGIVGARSHLRVQVSEQARELIVDEQAALRRVAASVAGDLAPADVFAAVAREVGQLLGMDATHLGRYEPDDTVVSVANWSAAGYSIPGGMRLSVAGENVAALVLRSGRPARMDRYEDASGPIAETVRRLGLRSSVGVPIAVHGRLWGVIIVSSHGQDPLPEDTEARTAGFTELVATAIANSEARSELLRLADEQAALRRVATLVAQGVPPNELFGGVTEEAGRLLGADLAGMIRYQPDHTARPVAAWSAAGEHPPLPDRWPMEEGDPATLVAQTGGPVRIDDWHGVPGPMAAYIRDELGITSSVGGPILVDGRLWGALAVHATGPRRLPADTDSRLENFTELLATAISNADARTEVERLAAEQAALRRVATLVAEEPSPGEVVAKVVEEVASVLGIEATSMVRYHRDGTAQVVADWGTRPGHGLAVGTRVEVQGRNLTTLVLRTGRAARIDDYATSDGAIGEAARQHGIASGVACPITVGGRLWGAMIALSRRPGPLPADAESRIGKFTELVATAVANAEARAQLGRLAEEQAALRRVATLVAEGAAPVVVFDAVTAEVSDLLEAEQVVLSRREPDNEITFLAYRGALPGEVRVGARVALDGESVTAEVLRTGRPFRMDSFDRATGLIADFARQRGLNSTVGTPIVVDGRVWGAITASWIRSESAPPGAEERITQFGELLDTAIANADSRAQLSASRARMLLAGDEARRRVVRDLHDGAQQRLVHTIVTLKLTQRALLEGNGRAEALVAEALQHADRSNAELRELAHGLLPSVLTRGGLRAGVDTLVARADVPVTVDVSAERFSPGIEASAYFVVAEALTNVLKHSRAHKAEVRVYVDEGMLKIEVRDDGVGGADLAGSGLVGIGDRVGALGGRLRLESPPGGGTLIAVALPLSPTDRRDVPSE